MVVKSWNQIRLRWSALLWHLAVLVPLLSPAFSPLRTIAADPLEARAAFYQGDYEACIELTRGEVEKGIWNDFWSRQLIQTLLVRGRYADARDTYESVSKKFSNSIPLRVMAAEAYRFCGEPEKGNKLLEEIPSLVQSAPWRYSDSENLIAIGKYLLGEGADARDILESFYDRVLKADPRYINKEVAVSGHVAIAELALDKADYQEAVKSLDRALELQNENPHIHYLLARAWSPSDSGKASEYLAAALKLNPKHVDSLLFHAQNLIDSEHYDASEETLEEVLSVNAAHPRAWALKAAIAHLRGKYLQEGECRVKGLATWSLNPEVDFLAGQTLSKHYRFAEGVQYQRRALKLNPNYLPAKFQLAQDLLRVGEDDEGWSIVDQVSSADKYNVVAFNLRTLQDRLAKFTTIEVPGFFIRMDVREAKIYGQRVSAILQEANQVLTEKYQFELPSPTSVEIFPQQSDFAIRTFGLPGGAGYLGVCFGSLITANSPASQGETPSNWESVLWHEFCHVVTLQKTNNRMPRWLSEGISVYEELERDSSWGQSMSPRYKEMILGEDFVPLSDLSGAFLNPKSPMHLQFAYFESSLAVRYLIERHGLPLLLKLLQDLGLGVTMSDAFLNRYGDADALDADFEQFAKQQAKAFQPETSFERAELPERASPSDLAQWLKEHPTNYFAQYQIVQQLVQAERWEQALLEAQKLVALYPTDTDPNGGLELLAEIARKLDDPSRERDALEEIAKYSADNLPALLRLLTLCREAQNWKELEIFSEKLLAVQPLIPTGHEGLVEAAKRLKHPERAVDSLRALKEMDPLDPAGLHFELAETLYRSNKMEEARLEVLQALEHSPRFREAQRLLVQVHHELHSITESTLESIDVRPPFEGRPPVPAIPSSDR